MSSASSTFVALQSPTAAQVNGWAQGTLGYAQVVANQTGITASVDLTSLTLTVTVVAGRRIRVSAQCLWQNNTAGDGFLLAINEGATVLNQSALNTATINTDFGIKVEAVLTPSVGSHTYKLQGAAYIGGTARMSAASTNPAFILVEDIGAV